MCSNCLQTQTDRNWLVLHMKIQPRYKLKTYSSTISFIFFSFSLFTCPTFNKSAMCYSSLFFYFLRGIPLLLRLSLSNSSVLFSSISSFFLLLCYLPHLHIQIQMYLHLFWQLAITIAIPKFICNCFIFYSSSFFSLFDF